MPFSTRIDFSTGLDFLTWTMEKTGSSVPPFEPLALSNERQPLVDPEQWLSFFHQICQAPCNAEAFDQPQAPGNNGWEHLLAEYKPIGAARYRHFRAYTALEEDGRFGKIHILAYAFDPTKVETISLIHWHQPIHYLHEKTLVVGADLSDLNFEGMDAYLQTLTNDPRFRKEHIGRFTGFRTRMTDLATLRQALQQLGLPVIENGEARAGQTSMPCVLVAQLDGGFDIGWTVTEMGTLEMHCDLSGINLTHDATQLVDAINQQYRLLHSKAP